MSMTDETIRKITNPVRESMRMQIDVLCKHLAGLRRQMHDLENKVDDLDKEVRCLRMLPKDWKDKKGVSAILGNWPGDETDEEVKQALEELS